MSEQSKYLFNPENGRVVVNTPLKRRVSPNLIPCRRVDGSDVSGQSSVTVGDVVAHEALSEAEEQEADTGVRGGFAALRLQIESSDDKTELCTIGADLGIKLTRSMKISTMQSRLSDHIDDLESAS